MADFEDDEPDTAVGGPRAKLRGLPSAPPVSNGKTDTDETVGQLMAAVASLKTDVGTLSREVHALSRDVRHQTESALQVARRTARTIGLMMVVAAVVYNELRPLVDRLIHGH